MALTRGLIVEFVGLPGAGKSTLSHAVAEELRRRGERVSEPTRRLTHEVGVPRRIISKLGFAMSALVRHPVRVAQIIRAVQRSGQPSLGDSIRVSFNLIHVCGLVGSLSNRSGIHLLDQGVFQALWSVCASATRAAGKAEEVAPIATSLAGRRPADRVVVLNPPRALLLARLRRRRSSGSRLEASLATADFDSAFDAALLALASVEALIGTACVERLAFDASVDRDPEAFRSAASELVAALYADRSGPRS